MFKIARKCALEFIKTRDINSKTNGVNNYVSDNGSDDNGSDDNGSENYFITKHTANDREFNLQEDENAALDLVFLRGYTLHEAANKLNLSADTVKRLVITATKCLKEITVA